MFGRVKRVHLVGVGGAGMSGIAEVLLNLGFAVSGSDLKRSETTDRLQKLGGRVHVGHAAANIEGADVVVTSTAVAPDNPEVVAAHERLVPVIPRVEMLAELMRMKFSVAVGGTHGKTTTTSLIAAVLSAGGLDPTVVVGGRIKAMESGARLGASQYIVAEADESDGSFLKLSPTITVVTTVDEEHLDYYSGLDEIKRAFTRFANSVPFYGCSVVCLDQQNIQAIIPDIARRVITYGLAGQADVHVLDVEASNGTSVFTVVAAGAEVGRIEIAMPGLHNVYNSLAAVAVGLELGVPFCDIARALREFEGISRRFEIKGEACNVLVLDDYGHHPAEIRTTLSAAVSKWHRRLVVLFQPHRYTRTQKLGEDFGRSFYDATVLLVTGIYAASETPIPGVSGASIVEAAQRSGHRSAEYVEDMDALYERAMEIVRPGDVVLTLGAGDIHKVGERVLAALRAREQAGGR
ncbi:MAG: UDP-N-acetylmuramate--L-alanine ligase [Candidatus Eisenbacteria bacterium]|nr:UDP-N-acetylmuramate--L-alanine ligase [Candidatus Eisenbacteria bacterium]